MPTLREVVAGILGELTLAQHSANQLSRQISRHYREDRILRAFPVPNASLNELKLRLRYGVAAVVDAPAADPPSRPEPPTSLFMRHARQIAAAELDEARRVVRAWDPRAPRDVERRGRVLESLDSERILDRVTEALGFALERTWRARSAGVADPAGDAAALGAAARETLNAVLWSDPDMPGSVPPLGSADPGRTPAWNPVLDRLARAAAGPRPPGIPELEVFVDARSLEQAPPGALQTLVLEVSMAGYRWAVVKDGDEELVRDDS